MAISKADWELMEKVAAYFESTRKVVDPKAKYRPKREDSRSVNDTAAHFSMTRSKALKMLITMGVYSTPVSEKARELRREGLSVKEIAKALGMSTGTVSSNLPYEEEIHGSDSAGSHALAMRGYRAYERMQRERQAPNNERKGQGMSEKSLDKSSEAKEDWKKELDSRLSFTETDSRRRRVTNEMIREYYALQSRQDLPEESGPDFPVYDPEKEREQLRAKLVENGSLEGDDLLDLGEFPGALYDRNALDLEEIYGEELPYEPGEMIRLHLELAADFSDSEKEILHRYGGVAGETISRDIVVSEDLPLYALHYVIQRAFGWQNSHLHRFYLSDEQREKVTESADVWMHQVGVIYRSPLMDEDAEFWADDYNGGSFKNWLRKKYTGPCVSQCWEEGLIASRRSMERVDPEEEYYVEYGCYRRCLSRDPEGTGEKEAVPFRCSPVYDRKGNKYDPPKAEDWVRGFLVEVVKLRDLPVPLLNRVFEGRAFDLLERLSIGQVLAVRNMHLRDDFQTGQGVSTYQEMLDDGMEEEIEEILESGLDSPMKQPYVYSFTDELFYQYDFGDNWKIRITGSRNCTDLVESGKISQEKLDRSNIKARVTYRPVLLCRDGEMLIEDVGGPSGFADFLKAVNTMKRGERDENGMTKSELKDWAKSLGWHREGSMDFNLI